MQTLICDLFCSAVGDSAAAEGFRKHWHTHTLNIDSQNPQLNAFTLTHLHKTAEKHTQS